MESQTVGIDSKSSAVKPLTRDGFKRFLRIRGEGFGILTFCWLPWPAWRRDLCNVRAVTRGDSKAGAAARAEPSYGQARDCVSWWALIIINGEPRRAQTCSELCKPRSG